jgi:hypothetical protein
MPHELDRPLAVVPAALAQGHGDRPFVAIVRSRDGLCRWLGGPSANLQWLQIEGFLNDPDAWVPATNGSSRVPIDVVLADPVSEFSNLYRLVEVGAVRDVRISVRAVPGFLKAVRLATSLGFPVRILPGQPTGEVLTELKEAWEFYLHEPMVEVPVEFFHSLLGSACGAETGSLWLILEQDPAMFLHYDDDGNPQLPRSFEAASEGTSVVAFVESHFENLVEQRAECVACPWRHVCRGYFKWPDPTYSCEGVKQLFSVIDAAAAEIGRDLAAREIQPHLGPSP